MPEKVIETFQVRRIDILDEQGSVDEALMPAAGTDLLMRMYELMVLCRLFDQTALNLQREGRLGTYASILGQEASQVGSALALDAGDWVFPSFREMAVYISLGYPLHMLFQYWSGDERGMQCPKELNIFPVCVPVGTQIVHATGAAMAAAYRREAKVALAYFGDGGTSKGDFHEGLTMAGVFRAPVVFICQNNQWAISVPRERQTASATLAQKAFGYGFEGVQVDGNDLFAVYRATRDAVEKARNGGGPTFIECFTYRMSDHTTADDASRYRSSDEVNRWKEKDPVLRFTRYLDKRGILTEQARNEIEKRSKAAVDAAVKQAEAIVPPDPGDIFRYTYAEMTGRQRRQAGS